MLVARGFGRKSLESREIPLRRDCTIILINLTKVSCIFRKYSHDLGTWKSHILLMLLVRTFDVRQDNCINNRIIPGTHWFCLEVDTSHYRPVSNVSAKCEQNVNTFHVKHSTLLAAEGGELDTWNELCTVVGTSDGILGHTRIRWQVTLIEKFRYVFVGLWNDAKPIRHIADVAALSYHLYQARFWVLLKSSSFLWFIDSTMYMLRVTLCVDFVWCLFAFPRNNYISTLYIRVVDFSRENELLCVVGLGCACDVVGKLRRCNLILIDFGQKVNQNQRAHVHYSLIIILCDSVSGDEVGSLSHFWLISKRRRLT